MANLHEKIAALNSRAFTYANELYIKRDEVLAVIDKHEVKRLEERSIWDARTILRDLVVNPEFTMRALMESPHFTGFSDREVICQVGIMILSAIDAATEILAE